MKVDLNYFSYGAVAQPGERMNGIHEVEGSIPFGSTNYYKYYVNLQPKSPTTVM